ncbi:MAG: ArsR family transcriptional regulator [Verrucomicrobia bacterium]|nr:MAG: ArsR family transcriptional regulator [Verrucomicrobiota bacterium]
MSAVSPPQPTLWRTCRVLANVARLEIIKFLSRRSGQTVSAVAEHSGLSMPATSQYLRALESRGLLQVKRQGRRVSYRLAEPDSSGAAGELVTALALAFREKSATTDEIFRQFTAFTHARRVAIYRAIHEGAETAELISRATRIPLLSMTRHLAKLSSRRFIAVSEGNYRIVERTDALGRTLGNLVSGDTKARESTLCKVCFCHSALLQS